MRALLGFLFTFFLVNHSFSQDTLRYTIGEETIIRLEPDVNSTIIASLPTATTIKFLKKVNKVWSKVSYQDQVGYVTTVHLYKHEINVGTNDKVSDTSTPPVIVYFWDAQLGCYYLNKKGQKIAVVNRMCEENPPSKNSLIDAPSGSSTSAPSSPSSSYSDSPTYTGPRGGTYHYTKSGKKSYYKKKN